MVFHKRVVVLFSRGEGKCICTYKREECFFGKGEGTEGCEGLKKGERGKKRKKEQKK